MPKNNASWPGTPKPEPNPLITNPDGSQSPNPRYQGPNRYRKGPDGKLSRVTSPKAPKPGLGGLGGLFGMASSLATAITTGYQAGMAVDSQRTGKETGFVSGRGAGRRGVVETGGRGHIPVTTYADGTPVPGAISPRPVPDLRGSVTPGSMEPAADNKGEGAAMDRADRFRPGAGYPAGVQRPGETQSGYAY